MRPALFLPLPHFLSRPSPEFSLHLLNSLPVGNLCAALEVKTPSETEPSTPATLSHLDTGGQKEADCLIPRLVLL
jgi:hypothetical protein